MSIQLLCFLLRFFLHICLCITDIEVVLAAVRQNGRALAWADAELQATHNKGERSVIKHQLTGLSKS